MDMISAVKDMNVVSGLENISKSKIRGIFGMLKTCQSLGFSNDDGDAVQLYMGEGVTSFEEFRNKSDSYFKRCLSHLRIFLPPGILSQLVWQLDSETMKRRLTEFKRLEETVESFFVFGKVPPSNSLPSRDSMSESTHHTRSISPEDTTRQLNRHQLQQQTHRLPPHHLGGPFKGFHSFTPATINSVSSNNFSLGSFSANAPQSAYGQTQVRKL
jgi:hypothetical protein